MEQFIKLLLGGRKERREMFLDDIDERRFQKLAKKLERIVREIDDEMLQYLVNLAIREMDYRGNIKEILDKQKKSKK